MYGLVRDERDIAWLEVTAISNYRNYDYKEAIESFGKLFDELEHRYGLDIAAMQKVIKAVCHIDEILEIIGVNIFSYELERLALKTKSKGLILLEEYEEVSEIQLRLKTLNESVNGSFGSLKEAS